MAKTSLALVVRDMPRLQKKMERIDRNRLSRLKEAKDTRDFKVMIQQWANARLVTKILSDKQRLAIALMVDFVHNYSYEYIAAKVGIEIATLYHWRNDPLFLRELDKEITRRRSFIRIHAFRNIHRAITRGDMKATYMYLKMSGDLKENVELIDNTGREAEMDDNQLDAEISRLGKHIYRAKVKANGKS